MSGRARSSRSTKDLTLKPTIRWTTGQWVARREGFRGKDGPARACQTDPASLTPSPCRRRWRSALGACRYATQTLTLPPYLPLPRTQKPNSPSDTGADSKDTHVLDQTCKLGFLTSHRHPHGNTPAVVRSVAHTHTHTHEIRICFPYLGNSLAHRPRSDVRRSNTTGGSRTRGVTHSCTALLMMSMRE